MTPVAGDQAKGFESGSVLSVCRTFYLGIHRVPFTGSTAKACSLSGGGLGICAESGGGSASPDSCRSRSLRSPSVSEGDGVIGSKPVDPGDPGVSRVPLDDMEQ